MGPPIMTVTVTAGEPGRHWHLVAAGTESWPGTLLLWCAHTVRRTEVSPVQSHSQQGCREWPAHDAGDGDSASSEAGVRALLQQVLKDGKVGRAGVVRHVRAAHERRPAPAQVVLVDLYLPPLHQKSHTLQLQRSAQPLSAQVRTPQCRTSYLEA